MNLTSSDHLYTCPMSFNAHVSFSDLWMSCDQSALTSSYDLHGFSQCLDEENTSSRFQVSTWLTVESKTQTSLSILHFLSPSIYHLHFFLYNKVTDAEVKSQFISINKLIFTIFLCNVNIRYQISRLLWTLMCSVELNSTLWNQMLPGTSEDRGRNPYVG